MINSGRKYWFKTLTRIIIPGVLFCAICSCNNSNEEIISLTGAGSMQEDRAHDVTFIYSKEGKVKMKVSALEFVRNESAKPSYIDMNNHIKAEFFDDSGRLESTITADSCRYYDQQGNVLVWDSVQIVTTKGQQLNTSELVWNQSMQKFFTEKPVKISTPTEVLYGNGMEANSDFSWYQIIKPQGTVHVAKGELPN